MQVPRAETELHEVVGEVLGHPFGEGGDQSPLAPLRDLAQLGDEVVDLAAHGMHLHLGIHQPRGPHDLLHDLLGDGPLVGARRGRHEDHLLYPGLEFLEGEGAVIQGGRKPEPVLHQGFFPGAVAVVHPPQLGNGHMGFINHHEEIRREVVKEGPRGFSGFPAVQMAGIVFDPRAIPHLPEHLQVEAGALLEPLGLQEFPLGPQFLEPFLQLLFDAFDGPAQPLLRGHIMGGRRDRHPLPRGEGIACEGIDHGDPLHFVPKPLDAVAHLLRGGDDLQNIAPQSKSGPLKSKLIPPVLEEHKLAKDLVQIVFPPDLQGEGHGVIVLGGTKTVDAGNRGHDDHVPALKEAGGGGMAQAIDLLVYLRVLFDVGVGFGDIGLGLVVVVVGNEIVHGVIREKLAEFPVKLGGEGLVVGDY